jgi:hypothetical protein
MTVTLEEIEAAKNENAWTKAALAVWGVPWPPPKGWKEMLVSGGTFDANQFTPSPIRSDISAHDLLRQVVLAVVDAGHARDLDDYPDVLFLRTSALKSRMTHRRMGRLSFALTSEGPHDLHRHQQPAWQR